MAFRDNYRDPPTLGQWVLEDLTMAINQMYPPEQAPGPLERDAAEHEAFAQSRTGVYNAAAMAYRPTAIDKSEVQGPGDGQGGRHRKWTSKHRPVSQRSGSVARARPQHTFGRAFDMARVTVYGHARPRPVSCG